jgi:Xaa-Pro aminopeptidase
MVEAGLPALLASNIHNVRWLSGFTGSFGFVVLTPSEAAFFSDSRYTAQAESEVLTMAVATCGSPRSPFDLVREWLHGHGVAEIGFEAASVPYATWESWQRLLAPTALIPAPDIIGKLRMVKSDLELARIRDACGIADACVAHVSRMIQPGVCEHDISLDIEFFIRRSGAQIAFLPGVTSGERSALPHGRATDKRLQEGDFVILDLGAQVDGYVSDITRSFVVGAPTERHRKIYETVLRAQTACIEALVPGANGKKIHQMAIDILAEQGLAQYFGHGLGHGIGLEVHDGGRLHVSTDQVIEVGQVWTIEPGVYIPGFGGVRIEDDVLVTEAGPEVLTHAPKHLHGS